MIGFFYDTETTGLPKWKLSSSHPSQPHIVQIAAHLVDLDTKDVLQSIDVVVKPDGYTIPDEAAAIHGITNEYAIAVGLPAFAVIPFVLYMWLKADVRIAHNESFDERIMRIDILRHIGRDHAETWKAGKAECTSDMSIDIVNCPPTPKMIAAGMRGPKKPRMSEAYKHFTGKDLLNAHSAIADVNACMEVYFAVKEQNNE